jgi:hypothetical protein
MLHLEGDNPSVCPTGSQLPLHRGAEGCSLRLADFFLLPPLCKGRCRTK